MLDIKDKFDLKNNTKKTAIHLMQINLMYRSSAQFL